MTHDEMIAVIQAHKDGKRIEAIHSGFREWIPCENPKWNFSCVDYRIAREPRKCWVRWNKETGRPELFYAHELPSTQGWQLVTEQL